MLCAALALSLQLSTAALPASPVTHAVATTATASSGASFNPLIGLLEFGVGAVAGYGATLVGVLLNIRHGGLSWPPDDADIMLLGVAPAITAAAGSWLIGLLDLSQRSVVWSALHAVIGGVVGQAAGLGLGYLVGRRLIGTGDANGAMAIAVFAAPAVAALGSTLFMELFKSGPSSASASVLPLRDARGLSGFAPAVAVTF